MASFASQALLAPFSAKLNISCLEEIMVFEGQHKDLREWIKLWKYYQQMWNMGSIFILLQELVWY